MTTLAAALETFASKGPVNVPGAQHKAQAAWRELQEHLTPFERMQVTVARAHAVLMGEGRGEFDEVMRAARERLNAQPPRPRARKTRRTTR